MRAKAKLLSFAERWSVNLWTLVLAPTIWALHFLVCYVVAAIYCAKYGRLESLSDVRAIVAVVTVLALVAVAVAGFVAWVHSRSEGDPPPHQESSDEDRERFLAVAKLLLAVLSFIAIVFTAVPAFIFGDCR